MPVAAADRIRAHDHPRETQLAAHAANLRHRIVDVLHQEDAGPIQPLRGGGAELRQPVVVGARDGGGEAVVVVDFAHRGQREAGKQHRRVDALDVHRFELGVRPPASLLELDVLIVAPATSCEVYVPACFVVDGSVGEARLRRVGLASVEDVQVVERPVFERPSHRGVIPVLRFDVALPQIHRLAHVEIAVQNLETVVGHGLESPGSFGTR